jgi:hypothetical protein
MYNGLTDIDQRGSRGGEAEPHAHQRPRHRP